MDKGGGDGRPPFLPHGFDSFGTVLRPPFLAGWSQSFAKGAVDVNNFKNGARAERTRFLVNFFIVPKTHFLACPFLLSESFELQFGRPLISVETFHIKKPKKYPKLRTIWKRFYRYFYKKSKKLQCLLSPLKHRWFGECCFWLTADIVCGWPWRGQQQCDLLQTGGRGCGCLLECRPDHWGSHCHPESGQRGIAQNMGTHSRSLWPVSAWRVSKNHFLIKN